MPVTRDYRRNVTGMRMHSRFVAADVLNSDRIARVGRLLRRRRTADGHQKGEQTTPHPKTSLLTKIANAMIVAATAHTASSAMQKAMDMSSYGGGWPV